MFGTSKLLNINDATKRIGNFFKLPIQLFHGVPYPELTFLNIFNMDISLIGANAGSVWNALHENGEMDLTKLKKETKLSETEILAAIGWLAREGKVLSVETKKGRRIVELFSLAD